MVDTVAARPTQAPDVLIDEVEGLIVQSASPTKLALRRYRHHRAAMIATVALIIIAVACFAAPIIAPYAENEAVNVSEDSNLKAIHVPPNAQFWFGTDSIGRDLYSRILYGGQVSLFVGIASAISAGLIGTVIGAFAGFRGGRIDNMLMRGTDLFIGLPLLVILIIMRLLPEKQPWAATVLGEPGSKRLMVTLISLVAWMTTARIVRGVVLSLKEKEFIEAARAVGARDRRIIVRHLVPNTIGPIVVSLTFIVAAAIGLESTLSFFGFGLDPTQSSWGNLLADAGTNIITKKWWLVLFPSLVLLITILCINFMGDGLRDALDPKQEQRVTG
ncbi:MAG TPA: ABC transporter permease [Acidimicrobiia bacterium]